jgi:hypothetical protein
LERSSSEREAILNSMLDERKQSQARIREALEKQKA